VSGGWAIMRRWLRDRLISTVAWSVGLAVMIVLTAAFYPSLSDVNAVDGLADSEGAMSAFLGLDGLIDPSSPLGYLWIGLYANVVPMTLMAYGIALGSAAIAGDEETGTVEYMLSQPLTRTTLAVSRFAGAVVMLAIAAIVSGLSLLASVPLFELGDDVTTTGADGVEGVQPGVSIGDVVAGTVASFAVGLGFVGISYFLGALSGRKGFTVGVASAIAVGGYVLYSVSDTTDSLEWTTWMSPWRWYIDDAMLINGLTADVLLPCAVAVVGLVAGWQVFLRRDLEPPRRRRSPDRR